VVAVDTPAVLFTSASAATGAGLGAGLGAGFDTGLGAGFSRATGIPFFIGERTLVTLTGAGVGFGVALVTGVFEIGALATGAFAAGDLATGALVAGATVRLVVTDFAHTVTEVAPVFEE
jgi:hypothetical protein